MNERRQVTLITVAGSTGSALVVALLGPFRGWAQLVIVMTILIAGQVVRYAWFWRISQRGKEKKLSRKEYEQEVRNYFHDNPDVAARFVKLDDLYKRARFHDALQLANVLKRENLSPVINRYVQYKIDQIKRQSRFGAK